MEHRGPWTRHSTETLLERRFFTVLSDRVTTPGGTDGLYDWLHAPALVRVAALTSDNWIFIVRQHHYLPNRPAMMQLPGGNIGAGELPANAAARELAEEVGARASSWRSFGSVWPMPGLTSAQVHLWLAKDLELGQNHLEESEADLVATPIPLDQAVKAVMNGTMGCAASAQLILAVGTVR